MIGKKTNIPLVKKELRDQKVMHCTCKYVAIGIGVKTPIPKLKLPIVVFQKCMRIRSKRVRYFAPCVLSLELIFKWGVFLLKKICLIAYKCDMHTNLLLLRLDAKYTMQRHFIYWKFSVK